MSTTASTNHTHPPHRRRRRINGGTSNSTTSTSNTGKVVSVLITTSHPSDVSSNTNTTTSASATSTSGGALTLLCPRSGSIQSSTRIHAGDIDYNNYSTTSSNPSSHKGRIGISHLSFFPKRLGHDGVTSASSNTSLAMAYGASMDKKNDSYGMLISVRHSHRNTASLPPTIHWKCRLPESNMSGGLIVSPVTLQHVVGGGYSGSVYIWNSIQNGTLLRTIPSVHYRPITCMIWSHTNSSATTTTTALAKPWNAMLLTGGADGMVHCFSHIDLVESTGTGTGTSAQPNKIQPIRSWTNHNLPVTSLVSMNNGRVVSSGEDGVVVIMELCSGSTVATIQFPNAIRTLQINAQYNRFFAGSSVGIIYIIDMDAYALHNTMQMGATIVQMSNQQHPVKYRQSIHDQVFGTTDTLKTNANGATTDLTYQSELRGHDHAITSLAVFDEIDDSNGTLQECFISGDASGMVRIWDTRRACCVRVVYPWSSSSSTSNSITNKASSSLSSSGHPVTAIHILRDESNPFDTTSDMANTTAMFGDSHMDQIHNSKRKRNWNVANIMAPLQKFSHEEDSIVSMYSTIPVPFLQPCCSISSSDFFGDVTTGVEIVRAAFQSYRHQSAVLRQQEQRHNCTLVHETEATTQTPTPTEENVMVEEETNPTAIATVICGTDDAKSLHTLQLQSEVERLQKELKETKQTVARWELVNNKLLEKIDSRRTE
jgi:WD40 repeat protein